MRRRTLLKLTLVPAALLFGTGHTPYRQWSVYRKRYLLILTNKSQPASYELGKQMAKILAAQLPASKARVTRAPNTQRIASLISTGQLDLALMQHGEATALWQGKAPFTGYGPVPLRMLVVSGAYLLVCRDDFPTHHAYLVAKTLDTQRHQFADAVMPTTAAAAKADVLADIELLIHPGALAYYQGRALEEHSN